MDRTALENAPLPQGAADNDTIGTEMYYRTPNGEIQFGRIGMDDSEKIKRVREGWTPLEAYGTFKVQPYHMDHPYEVLFERGGAKEFGRKQIVDLGLHFRETLIPRCGATVGEQGHIGNRRTLKHTAQCWAGAEKVTFPQLEGEVIEGPFSCKWCSDDTGESRLFPTQRGLRQHESVMHIDEIGSDRLGAQLIAGLGGRLAPAGNDMDMRGELLKLQEQVEAMKAASGGQPFEREFTPAATPYVCGLCGEALPNAFGLNKHISEHKKEPAVA